METPKNKIAVIGLGIMGHGIAMNFLKAGYAVTVWNRSVGKATDLVPQGAALAATPKEACASADIVFEVTADDASSRKVWLGETGILAGATLEKTLIASSSLSLSWTEELEAHCQKLGMNFMDIPLTGGRAGAESGKLVLLVGGKKASLEVIRPDLEKISAKIVHFGEVGNGMKFKLVLNGLQAVHWGAFRESLLIAQHAGLDTKTVGDALTDMGPGSPATKLAWAGFQQSPEPINFAVKHIEKDLRYDQELARGTEAPFLDAAHRLYKEALEQGFSDEDWTSISKIN